MALSHVQDGSLGFVSSGAVSSALAATAAGALIVQLCTSYNPGNIGAAAAADDQSNTYTRDSEILTGADPFSAAIFHTINAVAGVTLCTVTPSDGTFSNLIAVEIANAASAIAELANTNDGVTGGLGNMSLSGVTPTHADNIGFAVYSWYSTADPTTPTGWTLIGKKTDFTTSQTIAAFYKLQATALPFTAVAQIGSATEWCGALTAFSVPPGVASRPLAIRIGQSQHFRRYP